MDTQEFIYPFDPTGGAASNKIVGEQQIISPPNWMDFYFVIPKAAPFFRTGLRVVHQPSGRVLEEGVDYHLTHKFMDATVGTAKPIFGSITLLDKSLVGALSLDYQTLGGSWVIDEAKALEILSNTKLNPRITSWEQVAGLPVAFPPIDHEWHIDDLIGMSEVQDAVLAIADALGAEGGAGESHLSNYNNPHRVNKDQVGLGNVNNFPLADREAAEDGTRNDLYMTPLRVNQALRASGAFSITDHANDQNNPHGVTKAQVGLGSVENFGIATNDQAVAAIANDVYMTPLRVRELVDTRVGQTLAEHLDATNNPHEVTKAQVGLSNVENYRIATKLEAEAATSNTVYMTPLRTAELISANVGEAVSGHANLTDNPHQVTKAQVGLSNVENYRIATKQEAEDASSNTVYMTPLRTAELIAVNVGESVNLHAGLRNNPHEVDKEQVGLGSVQNYPVATIEETVLGEDDESYVTPRGVDALVEDRLQPVEEHMNDQFNPHNVTIDQVGGYSKEYIDAALGAVGGIGAPRELIGSNGDTREYIRLAGTGVYNRDTPTVSNPDPVDPTYDPPLDGDGNPLRIPDLVFLLTGTESDHDEESIVELVRISRKPYGNVQVTRLNGPKVQDEDPAKYSRIGWTLDTDGVYTIWLSAPANRTNTAMTIISASHGFDTIKGITGDEPTGIQYVEPEYLTTSTTVESMIDSKVGEDFEQMLTDLAEAFDDASAALSA